MTEVVTDCALPTAAEVVIAGLSQLRGPESYTFNTAERSDGIPAYADPCALTKLPDYIATPVPNDQCIPAQWEGYDLDADPETVLWSIRKHFQMQRQMKLPNGMGAIGGWSQVVTVGPSGISQRILQRWPEDEIGSLLKPTPIDWQQWHRENPKPQPHTSSVTKLRVVK